MVAKRRSSFMIRDILHTDPNKITRDADTVLKYRGNDCLTAFGGVPLHEKRDLNLRWQQCDKDFLNERSTRQCGKYGLLQQGEVFSVHKTQGRVGEIGDFDIQYYRTQSIPTSPVLVRPCPPPQPPRRHDTKVGPIGPWGTGRSPHCSMVDMGRSSGTSIPSPPPLPPPVSTAVHPGIPPTHTGLLTALDSNSYRPSHSLYCGMSNSELSAHRGGSALPVAIPVPVYLRTRASDMNNGPRKCRRSRTVFSELQLMGLEQRFGRQKYLSTPDRAELARTLGLSQVQVKTWYQNRRMKWKKQVLLEGATEPPTKPKGRPRKDVLNASMTTVPTAANFVDMPNSIRKETDKNSTKSIQDLARLPEREGPSNMDCDIDIDDSSSSDNEFETLEFKPV